MSGFDITLNSVQYRIKRGEEGTMFRRLTRRSQVGGQDLAEISEAAFKSREDLRAFYQTSWSEGAAWYLPLVTAQTAKTYYTNRGFDPYTKPGRLVPTGAVTESGETDKLEAFTDLVSIAGSVYALGSTVVEDSTNNDIYVWTPGSNDWVRDAGLTVADAATRCYGMAYLPDDDYAYVATDSNITRFQPSSNSENSVIAITPNPGSSLFTHDGKVWWYDGDILYELEDPGGTPALTSRADHGQGADLLSDMATGATNDILYPDDARLAIPTSIGIFFVKNVERQGQPQPWVYRVEKDDLGTWISRPIATLELGTMAIQVAWHVDSLIVTSTPDWDLLLQNDRSKGHVRVNVNHVTGNTKGLIGVPLGEAPDESIVAILGSDGPILYLAGHKRVWAWDAVRGGIHPVWEMESAPTHGVIRNFARVRDSSGVPEKLFLGGGRQLLLPETADNAETVGAFDSDTATYRNESNYLDFGLPEEQKTLTRITLDGNQLTDQAQYAVYISVDDGAFAKRATLTNASVSVTDVSGASLTGYRFRYAIVFESLDGSTPDFRGLRLEALSGELVVAYDTTLEMKELLNVENTVVSPEDAYSNLRSLESQDAPFTVVLSWEDYSQATTESKVMRIDGLDIAGGPGEYEARVVLTEVV